LDAAHAFDARYKKKQIHAWADYTCYSFQAIKHFTTGDGGALVCNNYDDFMRSKALKWFGLDRDRAKDDKGNWKGQQWDVDIVEAGFKYNMNNVSAAIGLSQLPYIDNVMYAHRRNAALYDKLFENFDYVRTNFRVEGAESSHWVYAMQVVPDMCRLSRDELLKQLNAEGIMAGVVHVPNDNYTCFKEFKKELPGVRQFADNQFSLPCGWWLNEEDVRYIAQRVKELVQ
jgi:dTDP-4-amino-4,6-dideoxygalactose transaminase